MAVLSATAVAASYARPVYINIEPMSLIVFLSGIALGSTLGAAVGTISELVFSSFNPLGPAPIPILIAQVACMALIGAVGGLFGRFSVEGQRKLSSSLKMGMAGAYLTLVYDLVTNLGFAVAEGLSYEAALIAGLYFMVIHVASNTLLFGIAGPPVSYYMCKMVHQEAI